MKKIYVLFGIAILMASCAKAPADQSPEADEPVAKEKVTFSAAFSEKPAVKTVLDGESSEKNVNWVKDDDVISILWEGGSTTAAASSSGPTTSFSASVSSADAYYAVYPSSVTSSYSSSTLSVTIPSAQHGTFAEANIAVASTTSSSLNFGFKNLCALAKVTLTTSDISEIRFEGANDEVLAGAVTVTLDGSGIPSISGSPAETAIVLTPASGDAFAAGTYYFSMIPKNLNGLSIQLTTKTGKTIMTRATAKTAALERSVILNFGTLDSTGTPTEIQLTFDFTGTKAQLDGWPTSNAGTHIDGGIFPQFPLDGTNYVFNLADCNGASTFDIWWTDTGKIFMMSQWRYFGLPAIDGYKLSKVECDCLWYSDSYKDCRVGIVKNIEDKSTLTSNGGVAAANIVSGGDIQTWSTNKIWYSYNLSGTETNTRYYIYCANRTGFIHLKLTYTK